LPERIDSRESWLVTIAALLATSVSLGAPYIVIVALKPIAEELGGFRSVPSGAMSLAMLGTGVGGLVMGWVAERVGVRAVVMFGAVMVCAGLALSSRGEAWHLYAGHGSLIGLIGNGAINAPLYVYVTRWFAFGFGFSGLIPAYILTARQLFPAHEASWRIPTLLLTGMSGMGAGSWLAGVIYDHYGFYAPAFATGLAFNIANFVIIAGLVILWRGRVCRLDPYKKPLRNCFTRILENEVPSGRAF
jgi:MFS family permease